MTVEWRLRELLEERGITVLAVANAMGNRNHAVKLYRIASPDRAKRPERTDLQTIASILEALETLHPGEKFSADDLLAVCRDAVRVV